MKKLIFICLTLFLSTALTNAVYAQSNNPHTLNITTTAEVQLPANLIQFNINLNAEADTPQEAYNKQKELETVLVSLLKKYDIDEKDIRFQPISINEIRDRTEDGLVKTYRTRQMVHVTFSNFDIYEEIQIALINNGFDDFSGNFMSTEKESGMKNALRKAIDKAEATAKLMADQADAVLGKVVHMAYSQHTVRPYRVEMKSVAMDAAGGLLQYNQVVVVSATVSMEFEIAS